MHLRKCLHRLQGVSKIFQTDVISCVRTNFLFLKKVLLESFSLAHLAPELLSLHVLVYIISMIYYEHILVSCFEFVGYRSEDELLFNVTGFLSADKQIKVYMICMHFRQKKVCGSPRAKQNQQKDVMCWKAPRHAEQEGEGEISLAHSAINGFFSCIRLYQRLTVFLTSSYYEVLFIYI